MGQLSKKYVISLKNLSFQKTIPYTFFIKNFNSQASDYYFSGELTFVKFSIAYNYPTPANQYGADGLPCCPANTFCAGTSIYHN